MPNSPPRLPKVARMHWYKSAKWRMNFLECTSRIACRLQLGLDPSPNCTGEEMALHNLIQATWEFHEDGLLEHLDERVYPVRKGSTAPNDNDSKEWKYTLKERAFEDEDVLCLYEDGDFGIAEDNEREMEEPYYTPTHGIAPFFLRDNTLLTPSKWFIAFNPDKMHDHLEGGGEANLNLKRKRHQRSLENNVNV